MIFVTVGTHEQPFNRLLKVIDELKGANLIEDEVIIQSGYSDYDIKYCKNQKFFAYSEMQELIDQANMVITHGGPATFMGVLSKGKIPVVVPRQKKFEEHVNDHQLEFCNKVKEKYPIIVIDDIKKLNTCMKNNQVEVTVSSNNKEFCRSLEERIGSL